jgi:hypothetical protein
MSDERALTIATPRGLVVRSDTDGSEAAVLRVRRRWPLLGGAIVVVAASSISSVPLAVAMAMIVVPVAMIRAGVLDAGRVAIDRDGVRAGSQQIRFDDLERCELEGRRVIAVLHGGRRVRLFTGTRTQARWLVRTIEAAREARRAPMPLPAARLLTSG